MIRHRIRLAAAYLTAAVALTISAVGFVVPAGPGAAGATTAASSISLLGQTSWVSSSSGMQLHLAMRSALSTRELSLQVTLFSEAVTRSAFEAALSGPNPEASGFSVLESQTIPLSAKGLVEPNGTLSVSLPVSAPQFSKAPKVPTNGALLTFPSNAEPGVYPVEVGLVGGPGPSTLDAFTTFLVLAPQSATLGTLPLHFGVVFQIGAAPATSPDGTPEPSADAEQELEQLAALLPSHPTVGVSIALYPQFASALTAAATRLPHPSNLQRLAQSQARSALQALHELATMKNVQFLDEPYTAIDVAGASRGGAGSEVATQMAAASPAYAAAHVHVPTGYAATPAPVGATGLNLLATEGVRYLVLPSGDSEQATDPQAANWAFPDWAPFEVAHSNVVADTSDVHLESHLDIGTAPVLDANQMLADLADLYFAGPYDPARGVSLLVPRDWQPPAPFMRSFLEALFGGLSSSSLVRADTASQFFSAVRPGSGQTPLAVGALPSPRIDPNDVLSPTPILVARSQLAALSSLAPADQLLTANLGTRILLSENIGLGNDERASYLGQPGAELGAAGGRLALPGRRTITMTSLSAKIPISISSRSSTPMNVYLVVSSPSDELTFLHNRFALRLHPAINTIDVRVRARVAGDFQLGLKLVTPVGGVVLTQSTLTIRSTAISGVAVGLTAAAAAFLVVWWARSALKRRRTGRHLKGHAAPAPSS